MNSVLLAYPLLGLVIISEVTSATFLFLQSLDFPAIWGMLMIIKGVMIMNVFFKSIRHGLCRIFKNHHDPACEAYGYTSYPA